MLSHNKVQLLAYHGLAGTIIKVACPLKEHFKVFMKRKFLLHCVKELLKL